MSVAAAPGSCPGTLPYAEQDEPPLVGVTLVCSSELTRGFAGGGAHAWIQSSGRKECGDEGLLGGETGKTFSGDRDGAVGRRLRSGDSGRRGDVEPGRQHDSRTRGAPGHPAPGRTGAGNGRPVTRV